MRTLPLTPLAVQRIVRVVPIGQTSPPLGVVTVILGEGDSRVNVALQVLFAFIVTAPSTQSTSPLHPAKVEPVVGVAVRVTTAPLL